jgi:hypothetical protein
MLIVSEKEGENLPQTFHSKLSNTSLMSLFEEADLVVMFSCLYFSGRSSTTRPLCILRPRPPTTKKREGAE